DRLGVGPEAVLALGRGPQGGHGPHLRDPAAVGDQLRSPAHRPPDPSIVRVDGPWRHRDVSANGIRLHVAEALPPDSAPGARPPLALLVHGVGGIWWTLRAPMLALAEAGFHAVAVDLRGHGDSDKPPRGYDAWTLATDVTNLIRALGHSSAVIVGQGEGGFVAWTAAYRRPRAVRGLVV